MSRVLQQLFDVTAMFDMHLRPELVLLQRTMVTVEGVARLLDPEVDMWEAATPTVRAYINKAIGPQAQADKLRNATRKALEIAPHLPHYVEEIGKAAEKIADGRVELRQVGRQNNAGRNVVLALGAAALILSAFIAFR